MRYEEEDLNFVEEEEELDVEEEESMPSHSFFFATLTLSYIVVVHKR